MFRRTFVTIFGSISSLITCFVINNNTMTKETEQILKTHYNHPFYRDNPDYILKWKEYYESKQDINILFFMRLKGISRNHYWLYLALSKHFKSTCPAVSIYILREAIKKDVFGIKFLIEELKRYKSRDLKINVDEVKQYLEQNSIFLWGVEWVYIKKAVEYDRSKFLVGEEEKSFEEIKAIWYKNKKKSWMINDVCFYEAKKIKEGLFVVHNNANYFFLIIKKDNVMELCDYTPLEIIAYDINIELNHYFYDRLYRNDKCIAILYDYNEIVVIDELHKNQEIECKDCFFALDYEIELIKYKIDILEKRKS